MSALDDFRKKYPQYNDMSDLQVADKLYQSYPEYTKKEFYTKLGLKPKASFVERTDRQGIPGVATDVGEGLFNLITGIPEMLGTGFKALGYGAAQAQTKPKRFMQNVGGAVGEYGTQVGNLPQAAIKYAQTRGLNDYHLFNREAKKAEDQALLEQLQSFNQPRPRTQDENFFQRVGRSIHLPKPGTFDYAKEFGLSAPSFKKEAEADELAKQVIPTLLASPGGAPGVALQQFGAEENPFGVLAAPPVIKKTATTTGKLIPKTPVNKIVEYNKNNLSLEELADRMRVAEGTETPLGDVLKSPTLKKKFENQLASDLPYEVEQTYIRINDQIQKRAENLLDERLGKGAPSGDANFLVKDFLTDAYKNHTSVKNNLYNEASRIAEAENFTLDLSNFYEEARKNAQSIGDSPLLKTNSDFAASFRKAANLADATKSQGNVLGVGGHMVRRPHKPVSITEANVIANTLYNEGQLSLRSPNAADRAQGNLYLKLSNTLRKDVENSINKTGSDALKKATSDAKQYYKDEFVQFLDKDLYKILGENKDAQALIREIIKPSRVNDKFSLIEKVRKQLPKGQENFLGYAYLKGAVQDGVLSPAKMDKLIKDLGPRQFEALFPDFSVRRSLRDFSKLRNMNTEAQSYLLNPKTGARNTKGISDFYSFVKSSVPASVGGGIGAAFAGIGGSTLGAFLGLSLGRLAKTKSNQYLHKILTDEAYRNKIYGKIANKKSKETKK